MTFAQPAWLWLLPVALPLILLLHARRRRDVVVPSLVVWRRVQTAAAPSPSRRTFPWRDPLLWLQLLVAALTVVALARPALGDGAATHWVVLLDSSLSMNATDVEPSRFGVAVRTVEERWAGRGASGRVSLVSVGPHARLVAADWTAGHDLRRALAGLEVSAGAADWPGAAARAAGLAERDAATRVAVVTDAFGAEPALAALASAGLPSEAVEVVSVGGELVNVGVADVTAEPRGDRPDQWTVSGRVLTTGFARGDAVRVVASFRPPGTSTFLPWGAEDVTVDAAGAAEFAIPLDLPGPGEVQVRGPEGDHLPADDAAVVSLRAEPVRVAVVGEAHPALLRALASVGGLEVYAAEATPPAAEAALFDLVVVAAEGVEVPATSTLWLGAVPEAVVAGAPVAPAEGSLVAGPHPLAADIDPSALTVSSALPLTLPAGATPLLLSGDEVLAWARTTTTGRQVALGFDLSESDWAAQVSFPAFVAALVDWAAPRSWSHVPGGCRVGESCAWPREAFSGGWELLDPSGRVVTGIPAPVPVTDDPLAEAVWLGPRFDAGFSPAAAGPYTLVSEGAAVSLPVVATPLAGPPDGSAVAGAAQADLATPALWRWLAVVAATALAVEAALALSRQRRVVRRHWRTPLYLAGGALVAAALGVVGAPLPTFAVEGAAVWVGSEPPPAGGGASARAADWVQVRPALEDPEGSTSAAAATETGIAAAIERALARPRTAGEVRVVVFAAGGDALTVEEAGRLADAASALGARLDVVRPSSPVAEEASDPSAIGLGGVALPDRVRAGARFTLSVDVTAPEGLGWRLEATLDSQQLAASEDGGANAGEPDLPVSEGSAESVATPEPAARAEVVGAGGGRVDIDLQAGAAGDLLYRLALYPDGAEAPVSEALVSVPVGPPPAVLLVALNESEASALAAALRAQGLKVERATPFRMPGTLERLGAFDAVLLVDVPAAEVFPEYQALLERYVRELGGGLAIVGGTSAFGPGGYYATPLEDVSPVSSRITDEAPEVAMTFVLDRSGSMSGPVAGSTRMDVAKAATLEAIELLGERSLAAIVVFDTEARVVLPLTPVTEEAAFRAALASITPGGGTSIYPGLLAAHDLMTASPSATRHVVVLTDGLSQEGDFDGVLRALGDAGVSASFVGVGEEADRRQLTTLASLSGGTLHMALDFRSLPGLLAQEALMLAATPIEEGAVSARWAEDSAEGFLEDVRTTDLPTLGGYVKTTAKDEASVHAFVGGDDPLLASWRYGLGRVVAFTSDADGPWSAAWARSGDYGRLWAQVVRWAAERPVRDPWTLRLGRRGDVLDVVVDLPTPVPAGPSAALPVVELASEDGTVLARRELEWLSGSRAAVSFDVGAASFGGLTVRIDAAPGLGLASALRRSLAWPLAASAPLRSDLVPIDGLAVATGGEVYSAASQVGPWRSPRSLGWRPLPEAWLLAALVAFLGSLALRYGVVPRLPRPVRVREAARTRTASLGR